VSKQKSENAARNARIRELREQGKSQSQIAQEMGLTKGTIAGVLKNRTKDRGSKEKDKAATTAAVETAAAEGPEQPEDQSGAENSAPPGECAG
jgi:transcriptional regulator with XRE-family HTH domain